MHSLAFGPSSSFRMQFTPFFRQLLVSSSHSHSPVVAMWMSPLRRTTVVGRGGGKIRPSIADPSRASSSAQFSAPSSPQQNPLYFPRLPHLRCRLCIPAICNIITSVQRLTGRHLLTRFVSSAVEFRQACEGARVAGASRIIGIDLNPNRFEEAKKFGCTEFLNPKDYDRPIQQVIAELTNGGVDRTVECTGHIDAMISAFESVHDVTLSGNQQPVCTEIFEAAMKLRSSGSYILKIGTGLNLYNGHFIFSCKSLCAYQTH